MKKMILTLALVMFATAVSAQPLQNFRYDSGLEIDQDGAFSVTGGETVEANVTFDNVVGHDMPLVVKLELSSDSMKVVGEEFQLEGTAYSSVSGDSRVSDLSCSSTRTSRNSSVWKCLNSNQLEILASDTGTPSSTTVKVEATAVSNIKPGEYDYEFKIMSEVGAGNTVVQNRSVEANKSSKISTPNDDVSLTVNSSSDANVTVKNLQDVSTPSPTGSDFVDGVTVDVSNSSGEVDATGTVTISYESDALDEMDVDVYYYDDTGNSNNWENIGGTHYPGNNTVTASVDHFSTYAAFAQQVDSGGSGGEIEGYYTQEEDTQQNETTEGNQTGQDTQEEDTQEENQTGQDNETTGQETGEQQEEEGPQQESQAPPKTPAGQFFSSTTNVAAVLVMLLAALAAILQYSGRIDFMEYFPR